MIAASSTSRPAAVRVRPSAARTSSEANSSGPLLRKSVSGARLVTTSHTAARTSACARARAAYCSRNTDTASYPVHSPTPVMTGTLDAGTDNSRVLEPWRKP